MVIGVIWFHLELKGFNSLRDYQTVATLLQDYEPLRRLGDGSEGQNAALNSEAAGRQHRTVIHYF